MKLPKEVRKLLVDQVEPLAVKEEGYIDAAIYATSSFNPMTGAYSHVSAHVTIGYDVRMITFQVKVVTIPVNEAVHMTIALERVSDPAVEHELGRDIIKRCHTLAKQLLQEKFGVNIGSEVALLRDYMREAVTTT